MTKVTTPNNFAGILIHGLLSAEFGSKNYQSSKSHISCDYDGSKKKCLEIIHTLYPRLDRKLVRIEKVNK